jgi:thiol-disulfide isomerase/thioredoxin
VALLAVLLTGCQRSGGQPENPSAPPPAAEHVAQVEGIDWFEGGVDAAFTAAAQQNKLVFLYWGAEWCPPCHDLKAHVFPRSDFQQSLRQFVPVYLDGDAPGAQRIADEFGVQGYPSVVVLKADRTELGRISGGSDLASYADVLDLALDSAQPLDAVLASLRGDASRRLAAAECRRLAWNDWSESGADAADLVPALQLAAARCPEQSRVERDRLRVQVAGMVATVQRESIDKGAPPDAELVRLIGSVNDLLSDPQRSLDAGTALLYLDEDFFVAARHAAPAGAAALQQRYLAFLDALEGDARQSDTVRLLTAARRLQAAKALGAQEKVPEAIARRARTTLDSFLARDYDANARAGIINSASWVLYELGDDVRLRALLEQQLKVSRTPYYYMPDMADIEERAGNTQAALDWLERGYRESKGPATRFQWGAQYVEGLLRMSPGDEPRIRAAALDVIGELDGPDRIHARARVRLERLDAALAKWAAESGNGATFALVGQRWRQICARLETSDPVQAACPQMLGR